MAFLTHSPFIHIFRHIEPYSYGKTCVTHKKLGYAEKSIPFVYILCTLLTICPILAFTKNQLTELVLIMLMVPTTALKTFEHPMSGFMQVLSESLSVGS